MLLSILIGLILVLVLSSISYSIYIGAFVSGFLARGFVKGAIASVVVFGLATFLLNFISTSSITGAFIRSSASVTSTYEVIGVAAIGAVAGGLSKFLKH